MQIIVTFVAQLLLMSVSQSAALPYKASHESSPSPYTLKLMDMPVLSPATEVRNVGFMHILTNTRKCSYIKFNNNCFYSGDLCVYNNYGYNVRNIYLRIQYRHRYKRKLLTNLI